MKSMHVPVRFDIQKYERILRLYSQSLDNIPEKELAHVCQIHK